MTSQDKPLNMTVLSQVKELVERMKKYAAHEDDEFWSENDNRGDIFSEGHDQGCAHVAKEALALLPAIEAQQERMASLEAEQRAEEDELFSTDAFTCANWKNHHKVDGCVYCVIEKLEKALAVALADFTNEEQAAAQARLNESPATCYPDGGEIFDECLRARREQLTG